MQDLAEVQAPGAPTANPKAPSPSKDISTSLPLPASGLIHAGLRAEEAPPPVPLSSTTLFGYVLTTSSVRLLVLLVPLLPES